MKTKTVILRINDESVLQQIKKTLESADEFAVHTENGIPRDLLFYEITDLDIDVQFEYLKSAMSSGKVRNLVLMSKSTDPNILIRALKIGAREFLPLPLDSHDLLEVLAKFRELPVETGFDEKPMPVREGTIIHIIGSKGGVGTTTVAVNLARSLVQAENGVKVALVDMNLLYGDIPIFLNMEPPFFDWSEIARNMARLDKNFLMSTLYKHPSGLHVLPSPTGLLESIGSGKEITRELLSTMKTIFDYIVIDGGQNIGEMSKTIMKIADSVILVTLLNLPCLVNIKRLKDAFLRLGYPTDNKLSIVANRVSRKSSNVSLEDAERTMRKKITWTIPNDFFNTMDAINRGQPLFDMAPGSEITRSVTAMATFFHKQEAPGVVSKKAGLLGSLRSAVSRSH